MVSAENTEQEINYSVTIVGSGSNTDRTQLWGCCLTLCMLDNPNPVSVR
jgi:hypothetical protein